MIDIHTHILPEVDDGAIDIVSAVKQLKMMSDSGVSAVFLTPHFLPGRYEATNEILQKNLKELRNAITAEAVNIDLIMGREIYLDSVILSRIDNFKPFMGNSKYLLVETNMTDFPSDLNEILYHLVIMGFKPILAHPERYNNIIFDQTLAEDFLHRNVYLQINAASILGYYGKSVQKTAWFLIEQGFAHFLASDNHCRQDFYELPEAIEMIKQNIDDHTADLLTKINPHKIIENEDIEIFYLKKVFVPSTSFWSKILRKRS